MKTLVFIPVFNEKDNIVKLIRDIKQLASDIFILVVDDNSTDGTTAVLKEYAKNNNDIFIIHRRGTKGRGRAFIEAFNFAIQQRFDYLIEMDADFSHNPKYIPRFLENIQNADIVIGSRLIKEGTILGRGLVRNIISLMANLYIRLILNITDIEDTTSGFRCYRVRALEEINPDTLISVGPSVIEETLYRAKRKHLKIIEIPIIFEERKGGKSKLNLKILFDTFFTVIKLRLGYYA